MTAEAVDHALTAEDYAQAVQLVESLALPMVMQAYFQTVEDWLRAIPGEYLNENPRVNLALAWMYLMRRNFTGAAPYLDRLDRIFADLNAESFEPTLQGEWLALQAMLLNAQGNAAESCALAEQALPLLPEDATKVRSMTYMGLADAYQQLAQHASAEAACRQIIAQGRRSGDLAAEMFGISYLGLMILQQGRLHEVFELASSALGRLERSGSFSPFSATLYGELAEVCYEWREIEPARAHYSRSVALSALGGFNDAEIYHGVFLSRLYQIQGNLLAAEQEIQKALDRTRTAAPSLVKEEVVSQQVSISLALGRTAAAQAVLQPFGFAFEGKFTAPSLAPDANLSHAAGLLYLSALRILIARFDAKRAPGGLEDGLALADRMIEASLRSRQLPSVIKTRLLKSLMYAVLGDRAQSFTEASQALELAEPEGFISIFLEEGQLIADIFTMLLERGGLVESHRAYIQKILAAFSSPPPTEKALGASPVISPQPEKRSPETASLVEPLTQRELEVLRLIAAGASNQSIAEKLVITLSAVKKHTGNIYGKLNVSSRTQALARARQLHLLPEGE